jgi:hypothetical protein
VPLLAELQRQREERMHPELREVYRRQVKATAERKAREKKQEGDDSKNMAIAAKQYLYMKKFLVWASWSKWLRRRLAWHATVDNGIRARIVRRWFRYSRRRMFEHIRMRVAKDWHIRRKGELTFRNWVQWLEGRRLMRISNEERALQYSANTTQDKAFKGWAALAKWSRAVRHYRHTRLARIFVAWATFSRGRRGRRAAKKAAEEEARRRLAATQESLAAEEEERRQAQEAADYNTQLAEFLQEAEKAAITASAEDARREADKRAKHRKLVQRFEDDSRRWRERQRARLFEKFEREWVKRIQTGTDEAREEARDWAIDGKGSSSVIMEMARNLLIVTDLKSANVEGSEFTAIMSLQDGCVHFIREAAPDADPPVPERIDFNIDDMTVQEAREVAICHYAAEKAMARKAVLVAEREASHLHLKRSLGALLMQRAWRRVLAKRAAIAKIQVFVEQMVDPYSGDVYYMENGCRDVVSYHIGLAMHQKSERERQERETKEIVEQTTKQKKGLFGRKGKSKKDKEKEKAKAADAAAAAAAFDESVLVAAIEKGKAMAGRHYEMMRMLGNDGRPKIMVVAAGALAKSLENPDLDDGVQDVGQVGVLDQAAIEALRTLYKKPDWALRVNADGQIFYQRFWWPPKKVKAKHDEDDDDDMDAASAGGARQRVGSYGSYGDGAGEELPEVLDAPPEGYILCRACNVDFAIRKCNGPECDGYHYCFACFSQYHPLEHPDYSKHWAPTVSIRVPVRPNGALRDADLPLHLRQKRRPVPEKKRRLFGNVRRIGGFNFKTPDLSKKKTFDFVKKDNKNEAPSARKKREQAEKEAADLRELDA